MARLKSDQAHLYRARILTDLFGIADYERLEEIIKKHGQLCSNVITVRLRWELP